MAICSQKQPFCGTWGGLRSCAQRAGVVCALARGKFSDRQRAWWGICTENRTSAHVRSKNKTGRDIGLYVVRSFWTRPPFGLDSSNISPPPLVPVPSPFPDRGPARSGGALLDPPLDDADAAAEAARRELAVKAHLARRLALAARAGVRRPFAARRRLPHPALSAVVAARLSDGAARGRTAARMTAARSR